MVPPFLRIGMDLGVLLLLLLVMVGGPFTTTLDIARVHAWMPPAADTTANNNANNLAQSSASRLLKIAFVTGNAMKVRSFVAS